MLKAERTLLYESTISNTRSNAPDTCAFRKKTVEDRGVHVFTTGSAELPGNGGTISRIENRLDGRRAERQVVYFRALALASGCPRIIRATAGAREALPATGGCLSEGPSEDRAVAYDFRLTRLGLHTALAASEDIDESPGAPTAAVTVQRSVIQGGPGITQ